MKILIIEDDNRLASLIKRALEEQDFKVDLAYDGLQGLKMFQQYPYHLIITDIILPKKDGLDVCKEIRLYNTQVPILMLTALGTTDDKIEGFDAGADDYLVKPFEIRELIARIRVMLKRQSQTPLATSSVLRYADLEMNLHTKIVKRNDTLINLTPKEFNLLRYMLENPERVLSRVEISEKVWDTHFDTGTNFIDVYINYLRKKLIVNLIIN